MRADAVDAAMGYATEALTRVATREALVFAAPRVMTGATDGAAHESLTRATQRAVRAATSAATWDATSDAIAVAIKEARP